MYSSKIFVLFISFVVVIINCYELIPGTQAPSLCCPKGQALILTSELKKERCEEPIRLWKCQDYEGLPTWAQRQTHEPLSEKFQCHDGRVLVTTYDLFGQHQLKLTEKRELNVRYLNLQTNETESVTYDKSQFCLMLTDMYHNSYSYDGNSINLLYSVCYKEDDEKGRKFKSLFYPAAIFFSDFFILITLCIYIFILRKDFFGNITIGFLVNGFLSYFFIGIHYSIELFGAKRFLGTLFCKSLGYLIQNTFLAFFFWMSAMAFAVVHAISNCSVQRSNIWKTKHLLFIFGFAQGIPFLISMITFFMDNFGPCDQILPNMGKFTCFLGSQYNELTPYYRTPEFLYLYLIISIIMVSNIICFALSYANYLRQKRLNDMGAMKDLPSMPKLFIIMGIPWITDIISSIVLHTYGNGNRFWLSLALDTPNLLMGPLLFLTLGCKQEMLRKIKNIFGCNGNSEKTQQL